MIQTKIYNFIMMGLLFITVASCKKDVAKMPGNLHSENFGLINTKAVDYAESSLPKDTLSGNISSNLTLTNDKVWYLEGAVSVDNAVLTIEPGTVIAGTHDSNNRPGTLIICRHGQINAQGTSSNPIVFTSEKLLDGNSFTTASPGDFAGIIILGQSIANVANQQVEGTYLIEPFDNVFGGNDPTHSSGSLKYVRIEFCGFNLATDREGSGLTLAAVGSGTAIDHVQVSYSKDDAFEFFGGTVNCSYLIALAAYDDNFDFNNGYRGTIQYAVSLGDIYAPHKGPVSSDSNGIEIDNNYPSEGGDFTLMPKTHPILKNFTIVGGPSLNTWSAPGYLYAVRVRRGAEVEIERSIFMGYPQSANFDASASGFYPATSKLKNNIFQGLTAAVTGLTLVASDANLTNVFAGNSTTTSNFYPKLTQPFLNETNSQLNLIPISASPATAGGLGAFNNSSRPNWFTTTWVKWYF